VETFPAAAKQRSFRRAAAALGATRSAGSSRPARPGRRQVLLKLRAFIEQVKYTASRRARQ
jgi:hypothetical protein